MKRKIIYGYVWEAGAVKNVNEDSMLFRTIKTRNGSLAAGCICDGMGGVGNGEAASGYVAEQLERWLVSECLSAIRRSKSPIVIKGKGLRFFSKMNKTLFEYMKIKGIPMGTTASSLLLYERKGYVFHIGDSRIYRFFSYPFLKKQVRIKQLTKDHKKDAHTLTKCLGLTPDGRADFYQFTIPRGECGFLLCSDGFYRRLDKGQKKCLSPKLLRDGRTIEKRLKEMAERSMRKGEKDNISALYIKVEA